MAATQPAAACYQDASPTNVDDAYNALKTYLMLTDKRTWKPAHLTDQLTRFWRGWLEANRGTMPREQMIRSAERMITFYLAQRVTTRRLADDRRSKLGLVDQTRENLRRVVRGTPARERVYADIKARAVDALPADDGGAHRRREGQGAGRRQLRGPRRLHPRSLGQATCSRRSRRRQPTSCRAPTGCSRRPPTTT